MTQQTAGRPSADAARPVSGSPTVAWSRTFPGTPDQAGEARRFLAALLGGFPLADEAVACLGELVSNALTHSGSRRPGGTFTVRAELSPGGLRAAVEDNGGPWAPRPATGNPDAASGRGLMIVAALADEWDIAPKTAAPARTAWFVLRRPIPAEERVQAVRDWLRGLERRQVRGVTLAKISRDLWPVLGSAATPPSGRADPHGS
jgi:serine/threonine-protein kinase RsbW